MAHRGDGDFLAGVIFARFRAAFVSALIPAWQSASDFDSDLGNSGAEVMLDFDRRSLEARDNQGNEREGLGDMVVI
jgi:hypothetical protein